MSAAASRKVEFEGKTVTAAQMRGINAGMYVRTVPHVHSTQ
jgi:hypothetical protein